jgi:type IV pilus assembly protein PilW
MRTTKARQAGDAGFTLVELMVTMVIVLIIMGATLTSLTNAYRATESAKGISGLNNNLRIGMDLIVRDLIQVGQGMPTGRTVQIPNGTGALLIQRPHPQGSACTTWAAGSTVIPAVSAGPGCGPTINGVATDLLTTLAVDSVLDGVPIASFDVTAHSATVALPAQAAGGVDISTGGPDDVDVGDLMMFTKGSASALVYVTAVNGAQTFVFGGGDPMNLNQFAAVLNGTVDDLATLAPTVAYSASVSRIRMISYYLDNTLDATTPRLIRHMNWGVPSAAVNQRGRTVAFAIDNLQITYDMVDGANNPSNVKMLAVDLTTGGACAPSACSPNQIRKVTVYLAARSANRYSVTRQFFRNTLTTQVSLRSLALVDRYK